MKKASVFVLIFICCFLVIECSTFSARVVAIESPEQIRGVWKSSDGCVLEYPFEVKKSGEGMYVRYCEPERNDTELWNDYMTENSLSFDETWSRRYALVSAVYGKDYPYAEEKGRQTGIKLRADSDGNIYSTFVMLIPDNEYFSENLDISTPSDFSILYYNKKAFFNADRVTAVQ